MAMDPKSLPPGSIPLRDLSTVLPMAMDPESPPPGNIVFFSISEDNDLVHSYNSGSQDLQALALDWLPKAKCHHVWHSHTEANKTVGFLMRDGCTFFAIGDGAGASGSEMLAFLARLPEAYRNAPSSKEGRMVGEKINWAVQATSQRRSQFPEPVVGRGSRAPAEGLHRLSGAEGHYVATVSKRRDLVEQERKLELSKLVEQQRNKWWCRQVKIMAGLRRAATLDDARHLVGDLRRFPMCFLMAFFHPAFSPC